MINEQIESTVTEPSFIPFSNKEYDRHFYGHGKILLSGEYFILDGAEGLALPTVMGQSMGVRYRPSFDPILNWRSFDHLGNIWFEAKFDFWRFRVLEQDKMEPRQLEAAERLQKILLQVRKDNKHFLRDDVDVTVETKLNFPLEWGLGSSSTLLYNIAQWAYVSPFNLFFNTSEGSGYDIACTQSEMPIIYKVDKKGPHFSPATFNPSFKDKLFFVYLGRKQDSRQEIEKYRTLGLPSEAVIKEVTELTAKLLTADSLEQFEEAIRRHEQLVGDHLGVKTAKERLFKDYTGEVKSLGAWGGDYVLATDPKDGTGREFFIRKGYETILSFEQMIYNSTPEFLSTPNKH